jgi:hypothetical protein
MGGIEVSGRRLEEGRSDGGRELGGACHAYLVIFNKAAFKDEVHWQTTKCGVSAVQGNNEKTRGIGRVGFEVKLLSSVM